MYYVIFTIPVNYCRPVNMNNGIIQFAIIEFHKYINQIKSNHAFLIYYFTLSNITNSYTYTNKCYDCLM